jgi:UPF0271 protein
MGEGMPNDALLMPLISSANIACGYHAGNETIMRQTIALALEHNVAIGAHPGFADRENFGRTNMHLSAVEVYDLVTEQLAILQRIATAEGAFLQHVKPHGALYNMSAKDAALANAIATAVYDFDASLLLFGLSGSYSISEAVIKGLKTASEVFADRSYQDDGSLTPRTSSNAMLTTDEEAIQQVLQMTEENTVTSISGKTVSICAETICLHGDGAHAVSFAKKIRQALETKHIQVKPIMH